MLILSDNQDITRAGLQWLCSEMKHNDIAIATDKTTLARLLEGQEHASVVLDYTLFDFTSFDELLIWQQRFHRVLRTLGRCKQPALWPHPQRCTPSANSPSPARRPTRRAIPLCAPCANGR